jgi:hypothetical protein
MVSSSRWSLSINLSNQNFASILICATRAICPTHLSLLDLVTETIVPKNADYEAPHYVTFSINVLL